MDTPETGEIQNAVAVITEPTTLTVETEKSELQQVLQFRQAFAKLLEAKQQFFLVTASTEPGYKSMSLEARFSLDGNEYSIFNDLKPEEIDGELKEVLVLERLKKLRLADYDEPEPPLWQREANPTSHAEFFYGKGSDAEIPLSLGTAVIEGQEHLGLAHIRMTDKKIPISEAIEIMQQAKTEGQFAVQKPNPLHDKLYGLKEMLYDEYRLSGEQPLGLSSGAPAIAPTATEKI